MVSPCLGCEKELEQEWINEEAWGQEPTGGLPEQHRDALRCLAIAQCGTEQETVRNQELITSAAVARGLMACGRRAGHSSGALKSSLSSDPQQDQEPNGHLIVNTDSC